MRDLCDEGWVGVVKHDMEMLYRMYRFQCRPVLEPDDLAIAESSTTGNQAVLTYIFRSNIFMECLVHVVFYLLAHLRRQFFGCRIVW